MKKRYIYAILLASILVLACISSATAATMSVAASDSASTTKSQANLVCSGSNDRTQITSALNSVAASGGGTVYLSEGTFKITSLTVPANVVLQGKGPGSTLLQFTSRGNVDLPKSGAALKGVKITGPAMVYITASHVTVQDVTLTSRGLRWAAFAVETLSATAPVEDIEFRNCQAIDCDNIGFMVNAAAYGYWVKNLRFISCRAVNCGATAQFDPWVVGFDLAECASVDGMLVDGCYASGSYESGFHFESKPVVRNAMLRNCVSENNGRSPTALWGAGYVLGEGTVLENCRSSNNKDGFFVHSDGVTINRCVDTGSGRSFFLERYHGSETLTNCGSKNAKINALSALDQTNDRVTNLVVENCLGSTAVLAPRGTNCVFDWHTGSVSSIGSGTVTTPTATTTPAPTTSTSTQTASIKFTSTPTGGQIYIDGAYKGVTPATISGIPLGAHNVEIRGSGYQTWVKTIQVTTDFLSSVYSFNPTLVQSTSTTSPTPTTTSPVVQHAPYPAQHNVPGRVEAEDYDVGGFSDTTAANEGGAYRKDAVDIETGGSNYNVGWIRAGESMTYSVDTTAAGTFNIAFRVANPGAAKTLTVNVNGAAKTLTIPATGSFSSWQMATLTGVSLNAGRNLVKVDMGTAASFNFDYMDFVAGGATQPPTTVTTPTPTTTTSTQTASIKFTSNPTGGQIYIDGTYKGVTPATISGIPLGVHRAEIRKSGYQTWVKAITVTTDFLNRAYPYSYNPTLVRL